MNELHQEMQELRLDLGRIANKVYGTSENDHEFRVFSQFGDDGIIQWLTKNINISRKIFVEFGVENYVESNTRFLLMNDNWSGLVMDGNSTNINFIKSDGIYWKYNLKAKQAFITAENINELIASEFLVSGEGKPYKIGLLSIDVDGNDYWIWEKIDCIDPDIVVCEYNGVWGMDDAITIPYDPDFVRENAHYSRIYFGASIAALNKLANKKGYSLVAGNQAGNNVYFVRNDLLNDSVKKKEIKDVFHQYQYRQARDEFGNLSYINLEEERELIQNLPIVRIED